MKRLLPYLFVSMIFSGCSVRKSALLQEQSSSTESIVTETRTTYQDTTITYGGDTVILQTPIEELLKGGKPVVVKTSAGTLTLTLKDSIIIAQAIWDKQEKTLVIPATYYRSTSTKAGTNNSLKKEQEKKQPFTLQFWPLWLVLLIALIFPLLKKLYRCLRFPM